MDETIRILPWKDPVIETQGSIPDHEHTYDRVRRS